MVISLVKVAIYKFFKLSTALSLVGGWKGHAAVTVGVTHGKSAHYLGWCS